MPTEIEGEDRMVVHVAFYPEGKVHKNQRALVHINVWPAAKPTLVERLAWQRFLASVKELRKVAEKYPG